MQGGGVGAGGVRERAFVFLKIAEDTDLNINSQSLYQLTDPIELKLLITGGIHCQSRHTFHKARDLKYTVPRNSKSKTWKVLYGTKSIETQNTEIKSKTPSNP